MANKKLVKAMEAELAQQEAQKREREVTRLRGALADANAKLKSEHKANDDLRETLDAFNIIDNRKPQKPFKSVVRDKKHPATAGIMLSDWHCEERVTLIQTNGLNEYNLDICKQRVEAVTRNAIRLIHDARNLATVDSLVIGLLGDMITGHIHPELEQTNYLSPVEASLFAGDLIESCLRTIEKESECSEIAIVSLVGNHGRTTKKIQHSNRTVTSYEYGMYCQLARAFRGSTRIKWLTLSPDQGYLAYVDVGNYKWRLHHGDSIRSEGGIGGMTIPVRKQIYNRNDDIKADFDFFGHLHQWWPGPNFQCNSSLIGQGAYGTFRGFNNGQPSQTFCLSDHRRGMVSIKKLFCN